MLPSLKRERVMYVKFTEKEINSMLLCSGGVEITPTLIKAFVLKLMKFSTLHKRDNKATITIDLGSIRH